MYNHNKAQQSKNRVHISWDILYADKLKDSGSSGSQFFVSEFHLSHNFVIF